MSSRSRILLGAMSGTSADGVDVTAVEISGRGLEMQARYVAHVEHAYDADLRRRIFALRESGSCRLEELAKLGRDITLAYARAAQELLQEISLAPSRIAALAAHGQTLYHAPPDSIQWLDPSLLAAQTDLPVISDFRRADLAAGGQGAPLVPFADWILFRHPKKTRVILNLGGIANLTYLPAGGGIENVIAFDTGPGCCISDWVRRHYFEDGSSYDRAGHLAAIGTTLVHVSERFLQSPFFALGPPKTTDMPNMIASFEAAILQTCGTLDLRDGQEYDLLRTSVEVAARAFWDAVPMTGDWPHDLIVAGGGTRNRTLMEQLEDKSLRQEAIIWHSDDLGVPSQAREAACFAILGAATLDGEPSNVPSATGARRRVVLGSVTPRQGG